MKRNKKLKQKKRKRNGCEFVSRRSRGFFFCVHKIVFPSRNYRYRSSSHSQSLKAFPSNQIRSHQPRSVHIHSPLKFFRKLDSKTPKTQQKHEIQFENEARLGGNKNPPSPAWFGPGHFLPHVTVSVCTHSLNSIRTL